MCSLYVGVLMLMIGGILSLIFEKSEKMAGLFSIVFGAFAAFFIFSFIKIPLMTDKTITDILNMSMPIGIVRIEVDGLSAFFIMLIIVLAFIAMLYSHGYFLHFYNKGMSCGKHFFFFNILIVSMILVVSVRNAIAFLILWEIMSISSFFVMSFHHNAEDMREVAIKYIIAMHVGAFFLIVAFLIAGIEGGTFDFEGIERVMKAGGVLAQVVFFLFFIGFAFKIGLIPFHTWLPYAYPAAPGGTAALMAGVMKAVGVYCLLRIVGLSGRPEVWSGYVILAISVGSAVFGILTAISHNDVKKVLSFSSVENAGIIGIAIAAGMLGLAYDLPEMAFFGFAGALFHVLNHAIFKGLLFFGINSVYTQVYTTDMDKLGGVIKKMPMTAYLFLVGSLAIVGLPPFNGFISKFLIYNSFFIITSQKAAGLLMGVSVLTLAMLALTGALALAAFTKTFGTVFLGEPRNNKIVFKSESNAWMTFPMLVLSLMCLFIGLCPHGVTIMLRGPLKSMGVPYYEHNLETATMVSGVFLIFIFMLALVLFIKFLVLKNKKIQKAATWGCGYGAVSNKMQYTGASFSEPLTRLSKPVLSMDNNIKKPNGLFPVKALSYSVKAGDLIERLFIDKLWHAFRWLLDRFSWIQSGYTGHYLLYILLTIVAMAIAAMWRLGL